MKRKVYATVVIAVVIFSILSVFLLNQSRAEMPQAGAKLYVDPSMIEEQAKTPPFDFYVNISVYNVTNMVFCEFNLSYTPGLLAATYVEVCIVQGQYPSPYIDSDSELGYVYVRLTYKNPITLPETSASLFHIGFTALKYGSTNLDLHDTLLKDVNGYSIPHEVEDGFVWIIKHDIAVVDCTTSTNETYAGRMVNIEATVKNEGNIAENFTVNIFAGETIIATLEVKNLQANETRKLTFNWNTTDFAPSMTPYPIKTEASVVPYETNTANNIYLDGTVKIKLVGDINGDGTVNINDLVLWDNAFNTKSGDANWNPQADINGDDIVNTQDGILIIQNYQNKF